jgi:hypothetical protein
VLVSTIMILGIISAFWSVISNTWAKIRGKEATA